MPVENLTRDEARERARLVDVVSYDVALDLRGAGAGEPTFPSATTVVFTCREPGESTHIDITSAGIVDARLNGQPVDCSAYDGRRLQLPPLAETNELRIVANCVYTRTGEGLHRFVDPVDDETYLYSQFETFDAHRMYACFDQPDLKATFTFVVDASPDWEVVSTMPATQADGHWVFEPTPRQSTYITSLIAGPYDVVRDEHDGIALGIYCRRSLAPYLDADELFAVTKQGFDFFHRIFAYRYAWPKYDQLFVPEFNAGAMENAGAVTFLEDYVFRSKVTDASYERRAVTVLHEMAHMWFGDLVTMRWWDDLWLNESFAEYISTLATAEATRWSEVWTSFCETEKTWAYRQDQLPTTHPIAADIVDIEAVDVNFDGITYAKGASVLKQLAHYVGQDTFLTAVRSYFRQHAYGNTTLQDLLDALSEASDRDLSTWSKEWLQTAGVNTLRPKFDTDSAGLFTSFSVVQEAPEDHPTLRSHRLRVGLYDRKDDGVVRRTSVEIDVAGALTEVPDLVGVEQPDLVLINDDDLAYAKIRLDDRSLRALVEHIGELRESLPRALLWAASWDMTRDAEMTTGDFLDLVLAGVDQESQMTTMQSLLRKARQATTSFGDPARIDDRILRVAATTRALLEAAAPGSDKQLAYARSFAANATTDADLALLQGLLAGSERIDGLAVDTELRWTLLTRLVIVGRAGDDAIDAERARDNTAAGKRHALSLRAARPLAEAKAEAWELAVNDMSLPNAEQGAVIAGFQQPEHRGLLEPYVEQYFADVAAAWERHTNESAQRIAVGLFPHQSIDQATVDRANAFLHDDEPPAPLRRLIVEERDGISRALRARDRDRGR